MNDTNQLGHFISLPRKTSYKSLLNRQLSGDRLKNHISYDDHGFAVLQTGGQTVRLIDLCKNTETPIKITNCLGIKEASDCWKQLLNQVKSQTGYRGQLINYYATKANLSADVARTLIDQGWHLETSSNQDLVNMLALHNQGCLKPDRTNVICNGVKYLFDKKTYQPSSMYRYAQNIESLLQLGYEIVPLLDYGEDDYFAETYKNRDVGLRMKCGKATSNQKLTTVVSRFGYDLETLFKAAAKVSKENRLTMLHTMISAAEKIDPLKFAQYITFVSESYFRLKKLYPTLSLLNIGGSIPALTTDYDHQIFLSTLMTGLMRKAAEFDQEVPDIIFELGSLPTKDSGILITEVLQIRRNNIDHNQQTETWAMVNANLMAAIIDSTLTQQQFSVIAINNANYPAQLVRLGDLTCDSDGRYPTKMMDPLKIALPDTQEKTYIAILGVGAYQDTLAGIGGVQHCGLDQPRQVILQANDQNELMIKTRTVDDQENGLRILGYQ